MAKNPDVVVVGGGIIGCAVAWRLAGEGLSVCIVEKGEVGRESSWAAGGILTPVHLADYPTALASLCEASQALYPDLVREVATASGLDPEFRTTGLLLAYSDSGTEAEVARLEAWRRDQGHPVDRLSAEEVRTREPGIGPSIRGALLMADIAQVRNHRLTAALARAARRRGAEIREATSVTGFLRVPGRVNGVRTSKGDVYAGTTVLASGAWSNEVARPLGLDLKVRPVKGQMIVLAGAPELCRHIILDGAHYVIPRADGRILVGSTVEEAGFDKTVTLDAVTLLGRRAGELLPAASRLPFVASWAGLRPATPDRLPYLGAAGMEGLVVATGHFRNGILLAPVTAELVAEIVTGREPSLPLDPFSPLRKIDD